MSVNMSRLPRVNGSASGCAVDLRDWPAASGSREVPALRAKAQPPSAGPSPEMTRSFRVSMLGGLSCSLAHELSQPLSAILSNAQAALRLMAHEQPDLEQVRDILADIVADDRRAGDIIHGLRSLLGGGEMHCGPLDLNEKVLGALSLARGELLKNEVSLSVELARDLPCVSGDGVQLQQVVLNLVMNACEAMSGVASGDRQLSVATGYRPDGRAEVAVIDRGCGIAVGALESIFEPFVTTREEGLGLGLALCRQIVSAHGGRLWAEHNAGRGSRFRFTVPTMAGGCA